MTKKRKPRVYNWVARGYKDFLENTPFKHAPAKDIDKIPRDQWTPDFEMYMDGYLSAQQDVKEGKVSNGSGTG